MSALPLASARLSKLFLNHVLDGDLCKNYFNFHIFSFSSGLNRDFVIYIDFTHVAACNTASDDVTS